MASDMINNMAGNSPIQSDLYVDNSMFNSVGIYSKEDIEKAKYNYFSRFGRIINPYGRLNNTTEYLFFVKPDLHIVEPGNGNLILNPQLSGNNYLRDFVAKYPDVVRQLQYSAPDSNKTMFANLLSFGVNSSLDIPSIEATTMDTPSNMYGLSYEYLDSGTTSDYNPTFSLEFVDTKELELYHFFKAYAEYHKERKSGLVTPPYRNYTFKKRLHNVMGIYKFLVDEDMETIIYWAYVWGAYPTSVPREAFSDPVFQDGLTFSVNFKGAVIDDMNPGILAEFNQKMAPVIAGRNRLPILSSKYYDGNESVFIDGRLPVGAKVVEDVTGRNGRPKYKLHWYL